MDEQKHSFFIIHENEQRESGFSFDSVIKIGMKLYRYNDIGVSTYCIILEPCCHSK